MKTFKTIISSIIAICFFTNVQAQTGTTDSIKVYGECGMCKSRIEKTALKVEGIATANWSESSKMLTVVYDSSKTDLLDNLQKKIAAVGHDTEKYTAPDKVYNKLPGCCHYDRKVVPTPIKD
ncbi:MAG: cation transporter [Chitinophagaceae bacterium]